MDKDGGAPEAALTCPRDGVGTRLRCAECQTPICPECFVRTAVGLKCPEHGAASGPARVGLGGSRRRPALVAAGVIVALLVAGGAWAATRGGGQPADDEAEGGERIVLARMALGKGELPGGLSWTLEARREGGVCTLFTISPGPAAQERCIRRGSYRAVGNTFTRINRGPAGTTYVTLGQVSDRTDRVRVGASGATPYEVPTLGGGTGLEVRFFVMYTTANVAVSFTALAADGSELGRVDRPVLPTH